MTWPLLVLIGVIATLAGAANIGRLLWAARQRALLAKLEGYRRSPPNGGRQPRQIDTLPAPIARHLRHALPEDTSPIRAVTLAHRGDFNLSPDGERWRRFTSSQRVTTDQPGFVWNGRISVAPGIAIFVHDAYLDGEGLLDPSIMGLVSLGRLRDREAVASGELMRFLAEAVWYPTALLPGRGVQWTPIDACSALATLGDGELTVTLTFHVGEDGLIDIIRAQNRERSVNGVMEPTPWEVRLSRYERRDGFLIPLEGEVAWLTPKGRHAYWRATLTSVRYDF